MTVAPGWIYVLELAPTGRVKVGRTLGLAKRLTEHLRSAAFSGGAVVRTMSFAVDKVEESERAVLAAVASHPRAVLIHGRETFSGISFMDAAKVIEQVIGYRTGSAWNGTRGDGLVDRCAEIMDKAGLARVSLDHLRCLLGDEAMTNFDLGRALRRSGVQTNTVWCPVRCRTARGVKREWLDPAAAFASCGTGKLVHQ